MSYKENHERRVTGQEAVLKWGDKEVAVTNVSWSREVDTTEVQHNDTLNPKILVTGLRFSGSFEYSGRNFDLQNALIHTQNTVTKQEGEPQRGTLAVEELSEDEDGNEVRYIYTFEDVVVTDQSRDMPSDDSSTTSWDWSAEDMRVKQKTDGA